MKRTVSLKKKFQFRYVYNKGKSLANRHLVMYVVKTGKQINHIGISVSVVRSRVTRLIRESYRLTEEQIAKGYDIVVIARVFANGASFQEIDHSLKHLLKKHNLLLSSITKKEECK